MQVWSPAWHTGLEDLALPQLEHRLQLQFGSHPGPGTPQAEVQPKKGKKKKKKKRERERERERPGLELNSPGSIVFPRSDLA